MCSSDLTEPFGAIKKSGGAKVGEGVGAASDFEAAGNAKVIQNRNKRPTRKYFMLNSNSHC